MVFLAPGASAPPLGAAMLMAVAGFAWGAISALVVLGGIALVTLTARRKN